MITLPHAEAIPLTQLEDGTLRITGTRIPVDTIIARYLVGDTPQEIVEGFPTVSLDTVYLLIAFYLRNQDSLDAYLHERRAAADKLREEIQARQMQDPQYRELRARIQSKLDEDLQTGKRDV